MPRASHRALLPCGARALEESSASESCSDRLQGGLSTASGAARPGSRSGPPARSAPRRRLLVGPTRWLNGRSGGESASGDVQVALQPNCQPTAPIDGGQWRTLVDAKQASDQRGDSFEVHGREEVIGLNSSAMWRPRHRQRCPETSWLSRSDSASRLGVSLPRTVDSTLAGRRVSPFLLSQLRRHGH